VRSRLQLLHRLHPRQAHSPLPGPRGRPFSFDEARTLIASGEKWHWPADSAAELGIPAHAETPIEYLAKCIIYPREQDKVARKEIYDLIESMLKRPLLGVDNVDAVNATLLKVTKEVLRGGSLASAPREMAVGWIDFMRFATREEVGASMKVLDKGMGAARCVSL